MVKQKNIVFLFNHVGLWIALTAGFLGQTDSYTLNTILVKNRFIKQAVTKENVLMDLPFELKLNKIYTEFYTSGEPKLFEAEIMIHNNIKKKKGSISVNHPCRYKGYDIYLQKVGVDTCLVQIVYDPWRYIVLIGIISMITGALAHFFNGIKRKK